MFGFIRKKRAISAAVLVTQPLINTLTYQHDLPERFWNDPYALGYLATMMGFAIDAVGRDHPLTDNQRAEALATTFAKISGSDGWLMMTRIELYIEHEHPELEEGKRSARKVLTSCYGLGDQSKDSDVARAAYSVMRADTGLPEDNIAGALIDDLFTNRMKARFFPVSGRNVPF
jgi:hypothetical protein